MFLCAAGLSFRLDVHIAGESKKYGSGVSRQFQGLEMFRGWRSCITCSQHKATLVEGEHHRLFGLNAWRVPTGAWATLGDA